MRPTLLSLLLSTYSHLENPSRYYTIGPTRNHRDEDPLRKSTFTPEYDAFCQLLRTVRAEAGLSQNQLAKRLDVPQAWLSKCENGQRRLDVLELWKICEAIGIAPDEFMRRLGTALNALQESRAIQR